MLIWNTNGVAKIGDAKMDAFAVVNTTCCVLALYESDNGDPGSEVTNEN